MTFSDAGLFYLDAGNSVDIDFWWGNGDDHGAVFVMARYAYDQLGPISAVQLPDPTSEFFNFMTSNFAKKSRFATLIEVGNVVDYTDPLYFYSVTVTNAGPHVIPIGNAWFSLEGMTSK